MGYDKLNAKFQSPKPGGRTGLRATRDSRSDALYEYYDGVHVQVLEHPEVDWAYVRVANDSDGVEGFVPADNLRFDSEGVEVSLTCPVWYLKASQSGGGIDFKAEPSDAAETLGSYGPGTRVQVLGEGPLWTHVKIRGKPGFILAEQLDPSPAKYIEMLRIGLSDKSDAVVAARGAALRREPDDSSELLAAYNTGVGVRIVGDAAPGWLEVSVGVDGGGRATGFMRAEDIDRGMARLGVMPSIPMCYMSASSWEMYVAPYADAPLVAQTFGRANPVEVLGECGNGWWHVRSFPYTGYVDGQNVMIRDEEDWGDELE